MSYHINCKSCGAANEIPSGTITILCVFCGNPIQLENSIALTNLETEEIRKEKELQDEIKSLIKSGLKLNAVKLYLDSTGIGLKEANDHINKIAKELNNK